MRNLGLLVAGTVGLWLLAFYPARLAWGDRAVLQSAVAAMLCLVPMALTMVWCSMAQGGSPEMQLAAVMGGSAARMLLVVGVAVVLFKTVEALSDPAFMIWVVVFYLATLTLEILLVVRQRTSSNRSQSS
jgi:hypothetical protein